MARFRGQPAQQAIRLTERYRRVDFGHMEIDETFRDPEFYDRPITAKVRATYVPDTDLLEYVCAENEKDRHKLIGTPAEERKGHKPVKVAPEILSRYVGAYDFGWPENPTISSPRPVTLENGPPFLMGAPLTPLSETEFAWAAGNRLQFFKDASGRITHFVITLVEGDLLVRRLP